MTRSLPPKVSAAGFDRALAGWRAILGEPQVVTSAAGLAAYLDPFAPGEREAFSASAALLPASVDEIRAVLRIANQFRIPLWTVSTGRNFAYGGAAPRLAGSVVLDLQRMNRIIEVNEPLAYALVEPGVSYFDLYAHLREHGYRLWVDPPAAGWGSVVGNTLERGFGYTAYGDHAAAQCGMEVVLANGDVLRTGMGGIEIGTAWQLYQPGYGPSFDAMFMQSNYGIVTKLGVWLMPAPPAYLLGEIQFRHEADLETIVDILRPLRLDETIRNHAVIEGGLRRAAGLSARRQWYEGKGAMPERAVEAMLDQLNVGRWNLHFALYGRPELIDAHYAIVQRAFAHVPQAKLSAARYAGDAQPTAGGDRNMAGIPAMSAFRMLDWRGGAGAHVDFAPLCPASGRDALRQYTMVKTRAAEYGFDYYGGFTAGMRHLHHIFAAIFDRDDANQVEQAGALLRSLMSDARAAGYGEYRAHLAYMDSAAAQYSFNDGALLRLSEAIKDALDPNGILAPGKQGIWPAAWRDRRGYT
ncbi:FAD-binding oxidoreductase [Paraburkholderia fungorum]|uniref:4-cresol dehydrogenase (Hydroxylating) n=1 Tax=Paraburkholderia fungorum TaxID=134537 RepID=A0AAW3UVC8_9BURK|nr:FAD-binding oxidoreductase [Paraburkholderia fungorum]MBB4514277.1 4-cresol dehydrogenase (hydroxylating) [Paraburkholderia fungorum]MBB6202181.1 4-cresol dehydrogenase (hydroxylating) [Paraburkholderia fungorum]